MKPEELAHQLDGVTQATQEAFGTLSPEQLNWKPSAGGWSIAQCLDHLITINSLYFPLFTSMRSGPPRQTSWERYSPFSGLLGKLMIKTLGPENRRRMKTSTKAEPSMSRIDAGIVDRFARHQSELIQHYRQIPPSIERRKTIVTSPLASWVTYSLDDCLTILVVHEHRHFQQAMRVLQAPGFPNPR